MIVYEYRIVRCLGDEQLAKALQKYSDNGFEPVTLTWVGDIDISKSPSGIVHPSQPELLLASKYLLIMRKGEDIPMSDIGIKT